MKRTLIGFLLSLLSLNVQAKIVSKAVSYTFNGETFVGYVAYDDSTKGKRPGILVVHEWWGLNDFVREKAKSLAAMGYTAFAPDMYGNGQTTSDPKLAAKLAGEIRGTRRMHDRVFAGLVELLKQPNVDSERIGAIGFCFGGTSVLELAYGGAPVKGIVTFHASIITPKQEDIGLIKTKLLILHGADDPYVSADTVSRFQESLRKAGVDWQMIYFGNSVHGFTNPSNGTDNTRGLAYNPLSAERAWTYMKLFFADVLRPASTSRSK